MDKKNLINEELKRFNRIMEYSFYVPENYDDTKGVIDEDDPLGDEEGAPAPDAAADPAAAPASDAAAAPEAGMEDPAMAPDPAAEDPANDFSGPDPAGAPADPAMAPEAPMAEPMPMDGGEEEVELDVTELVQNTDDAKNSAEQTSHQMGSLLKHFQELTHQLDSVTQVAARLEDLEQEIERRMPTDQEKLEMRSLDSYPYNVKLTDFWEDQKGTYDVMGNDEELEPKEFVLTKDKVDADFNQGAVKQSFNDTESEYEEEDIN